MQAPDLFTAVLNVLVQQWLWDVQQLSQPWMYWWFFMPAMFFTVFMVIKWMVLTAPLWAPIAILLRFYIAFKE
jgi:hypothetical protein